MAEHTSSIGFNPDAPNEGFDGIDFHFLLALFQSSPNAISIADLQGNLRLVNRRGLELFGHADDHDVIGRSVFHWIVPEDHTRARETLEQLINGGTFAQLRLQLLRRDGSTFSGEIRSTLVRSGSGAPAHVVLSVEDRTRSTSTRQPCRRS